MDHKKYLGIIGSKGGSRKSDAKKLANKVNVIKARANRWKGHKKRVRPIKKKDLSDAETST